jgi:hypothetical protein
LQVTGSYAGAPSDAASREPGIALLDQDRGCGVQDRRRALAALRKDGGPWSVTRQGSTPNPRDRVVGCTIRAVIRSFDQEHQPIEHEQGDDHDQAL